MERRKQHYVSYVSRIKHKAHNSGAVHLTMLYNQSRFIALAQGLLTEGFLYVP